MGYLSSGTLQGRSVPTGNNKRPPLENFKVFKGFRWVGIQFLGKKISEYLTRLTRTKEVQRSEGFCVCSNYKAVILPLLQISIPQFSHLGEWKVYCITNHFTIRSWSWLILMTAGTSWHLSQVGCLCETQSTLLHQVWAWRLNMCWASSSLPWAWPGYVLQPILLTLLCK